MRIYVESNFLLEIVRHQEGAADATELLKLASVGKFEMVVPAFSLAEPYWTLQKDSKDRKAYLGALNNDVAQLSRSPRRRHVVKTAVRLAEQLQEVDLDESVALDELARRLARHARVADLSPVGLTGARSLTTAPE